MQGLQSGAVVMRTGNSPLIVFFIEEVALGVGAVWGVSPTTKHEMARNRQRARKMGYAIVDSVIDGVRITTMLPKHWDREATIAAVDAYMAVQVEQHSQETNGGFNVN